MNRYRLIGTAVALLLLIAALLAKYFGGSGSALPMLTVLTAGVWILAAVDITAYKKGGGISRGTLIVRIISLTVLGAVLTGAVILALAA